MSLVNSIAGATVPADVRAAGTQATNDFKSALNFEQMLAGQLVKGMVGTDGPLAEGPYAATMQETLTTALSGGHGLGLARQLYKEIQSS